MGVSLIKLGEGKFGLRAEFNSKKLAYLVFTTNKLTSIRYGGVCASA